MKPEFNYESVPFDFSHCFCGQCKVADKCSVIKLPFGFRRAGIPCLS